MIVIYMHLFPTYCRYLSLTPMIYLILVITTEIISTSLLQYNSDRLFMLGIKNIISKINISNPTFHLAIDGIYLSIYYNYYWKYNSDYFCNSLWIFEINVGMNGLHLCNSDLNTGACIHLFKETTTTHYSFCKAGHILWVIACSYYRLYMCYNTLLSYGYGKSEPLYVINVSLLIQRSSWIVYRQSIVFEHQDVAILFISDIAISYAPFHIHVLNCTIDNNIIIIKKVDSSYKLKSLLWCHCFKWSIFSIIILIWDWIITSYPYWQKLNIQYGN